MTTTAITTSVNVAESIQRVRDAARALGEARAAEQALEDGRALVKRDAITRLLAAGRAASVTAAEKVVEEDEAYAAHRACQRAAVLATQVAWGEWEASKLAAQLAVALACDGALVE
jgi:hypothetical protein